MARYYVNVTEDNGGHHEVHRLGCVKFPSPENREFLGEFSSCFLAVKKAKSLGYFTANGCWFCSRDCHTG